MQNTIILLLLLAVIFIFVKNSSMDTPPPTKSLGLFARENTEIYRGWAILIIMIGHISSCWDWAGLGPLGGIGVDVFLLLSGFGLHESYNKNGLKGFWKKKILRIALPYVIFRIIWMMAEGDMSLQQWKSIICCVHSSFWYIDYIIRCYIAFWIACSLDRLHIKWIILIVFALYSFFNLSILCGTQALSFIAGVGLSAGKDKISEIERRPWSLMVVLVLSIICGFAMLIIKHQPIIHNREDLLYRFLLMIQNFTLAISFIIIIYSIRKLLGGKMITLLGSLSLELYIIHMRLLKPMVGNSVWQGLAMMITALLLAFSFNKFIQKLIHWIESGNRKGLETKISK